MYSIPSGISDISICNIVFVLACKTNLHSDAIYVVFPLEGIPTMKYVFLRILYTLSNLKFIKVPYYFITYCL